MKKHILGSVAFAAMVALSLTSCNKSQPQVEAKSESKAPAELKIAYVEVDSIMTQYKFAKEYAAILEKKSQNIQATLAQKQQNTKQSKNAYKKEHDAKNSIANYLARYNKDKKYSIIFSKSGDNLLYADKAYDITNEVISGLNKAYKSTLPAATPAAKK